MDITAAEQSTEGVWRRARGTVRIDTPEMVLYCDEFDYNSETEDSEARGNVHFRHFERNEEIWADRVEYNFKSERGKFFEVKGSAVVRIDARPGILATSSPFYFEGKWAEKLGSKYILHDGMITNCRVPRPWWTLRGPKFDIVPNDRAIAHNAIFRVRKVPLFYTPFFYKSLEKSPRKSGFLTPSIGNSNRRGKMYGVGYYWAINRSYDATYRLQNFTQRGFAHHVDFRGKPNARTDFNAIFYGVDDKGFKLESGDRIKQGGFSVSGQFRSELGRGFSARANINYLSSLTFRQAFTESFQEAIFSEVHSTAYVEKNWSYNSFHAGLQRLENLGVREGDTIQIRKLPEATFVMRDRLVSEKVLPIWVSLEAAGGLLSRAEPLPFEENAPAPIRTRAFVQRADVVPRVMTALRLKDFHILPSFAIRGTHWGQRVVDGQIDGRDINRGSTDFQVDVVAPPVARVFRKKSFFGDQIKHVIEPRASFRHVAGAADFDRVIRFDTTELLTNTTEAEISITNRFYAKRYNQVHEVLSWTVWQRRYFDPCLGGTLVENGERCEGGAIVNGARNVNLTQTQLTAFAFFDGPRRYSPVVSALRISPFNPPIGIEWRADYDPLRSRIANTSVTVDARFGLYTISAGHSQIKVPTYLSPSGNQLRTHIAFGNPNQRGFNAAFSTIYDFKQGIMQYTTTQVTYNTDCCGFSVQYRRFGIGTRNENQFRVAFAVANIGSFGTLKRQERLF